MVLREPYGARQKLTDEMDVSALENFSRSLVPPKEVMDYINKVVNKVVTSIQQNGNKFGVDRAIVAGSMVQWENIPL